MNTVILKPTVYTDSREKFLALAAVMVYSRAANNAKQERIAVFSCAEVYIPFMFQNYCKIQNWEMLKFTSVFIYLKHMCRMPNFFDLIFSSRPISKIVLMFISPTVCFFGGLMTQNLKSENLDWWANQGQRFPEIFRTIM